MKRTLIHFLLAFSLITSIAIDNSYGGVPKKFLGSWELSVVHDQGFPWWDQIKYPVKLEVSDTGAVFADQYGFRCEPNLFFYDDELDAVVFTHCLPTESEFAVPPFYRVKIVEGTLEAEVWTFKLLFKLTGDRRPPVFE